METMLPDINLYITQSSEEDEMFHLFKNITDDFLPYLMLYKAIRSGDCSLRLTTLKMVTERFVVSGATLDQ